MIYDCFTFFNELDILEIRLEELYPVVDKFIIVEGSQTFQGTPKPQYGWENSDKFEKYADKVSWCNVNVWPPVKDKNRATWEREYHQRNMIKRFLEYSDLNPDDIVLISDADEIPRRSAVEQLNPQPVQSLALKTFYYGLNIFGGHYHTSRAIRWSALTTPQEIRTLDPPPNIIDEAGWHFSYLGAPEHIAEKFKAFAHSELNRPDTTDPVVLRDRMSKATDLWGDGHQYTRIEIDDTWPEAIKRDRDRWRKYEW